jgi:Neuraminidase (sialidase)
MRYCVLIIFLFIIATCSELISNDNAILRKNNITYITSDGGKTWKKIVKEKNYNQFATINNKNGRSYTTDGGKTWQKANAQRTSAEMPSQGFSLYPNPMSGDNLNIALPQELSGKYFEIFIYDLFGRCLVNSNSKTLKTNNNEINLDLKDLSNGPYTIKFQSDEEIYSKTFIINR